MRLRAAALAAVLGLALGACTGGTDVPGDPLSVPETSVEPVPASPEVPSPAPSGPESAVAAEKRLCEVPEAQAGLRLGRPGGGADAGGHRAGDAAGGADPRVRLLATGGGQARVAGGDRRRHREVRGHRVPGGAVRATEHRLGHDRRDPRRHQPPRRVRELRLEPGDRLLRHRDGPAEVHRERLALAARTHHARPRAHARDRRPAVRARAAGRARRRVQGRGLGGRDRARRGQRDVLHAAVGADVPHGRPSRCRSGSRPRSKTPPPRGSRRSSRGSRPGPTTRGCASSARSTPAAVWTRSTRRSSTSPRRRSRSSTPSATRTTYPRRSTCPNLSAELGPGWEDLDAMAIGEAWLQTALGLRLDGSEASAAAAGWDGGTYRAWSDGTDTAVELSTVWDTSRDAEEFAASMSEWIDQGDGSAQRARTRREGRHGAVRERRRDAPDARGRDRLRRAPNGGDLLRDGGRPQYRPRGNRGGESGTDAVDRSERRVRVRRRPRWVRAGTGAG